MGLAIDYPSTTDVQRVSPRRKFPSNFYYRAETLKTQLWEKSQARETSSPQSEEGGASSDKTRFKEMCQAGLKDSQRRT